MQMHIKMHYRNILPLADSCDAQANGERMERESKTTKQTWEAAGMRHHLPKNNGTEQNK